MYSQPHQTVNDVNLSRNSLYGSTSMRNEIIGHGDAVVEFSAAPHASLSEQ